MKQISLTKGQFALVDDEDFLLISKWKWYAQKNKNGYYAERKVSKNGKRVQVYMHKVILGCPEGMFVDHKDGNGLNNQRSNLRICTLSQNGANKPARGMSKFMGVSFVKSRDKWQATLQINSKQRFLGYFNSEIAAAIRYNEEAKRAHGEFARLNIIHDQSVVTAVYDNEVKAAIIY